MQTAITNLYGAMIIAGFVLIMCCDTETPGQLLVICLSGFAMICLGGRALIKRGRE